MARILLVADARPDWRSRESFDFHEKGLGELTAEEEEDADCMQETPLEVAKRKGHDKLHQMIQVWSMPATQMAG